MLPVPRTWLLRLEQLHGVPLMIFKVPCAHVWSCNPGRCLVQSHSRAAWCSQALQRAGGAGTFPAQVGHSVWTTSSRIVMSHAGMTLSVLLRKTQSQTRIGGDNPYNCLHLRVLQRVSRISKSREDIVYKKTLKGHQPVERAKTRIVRLPLYISRVQPR